MSARYFIVENLDMPGNYFSCTEGALLGHPAGAFSPNRDRALRFARRDDGTAFAGSFLRHMPATRVVVIETGDE